MKIFRNICLLILISGLSSGVAFSQSLTPTDLETALASAKADDKKVLIDVYAEWCPYCEKMHTEVYTETDVIEAVNEYYYLVKINIESDNIVNYLGNKMPERDFATLLESTSLPTTYFMNGKGELLGTQPGLLPADVFRDLLHFVGSNAFESTSFDEFRNRE